MNNLINKYFTIFHLISELNSHSSVALIESARQLLSVNSSVDLLIIRLNKYYYNTYSLLKTLKHLNKDYNIYYIKLDKSIFELFLVYLLTILFAIKKHTFIVGDINTFIVRLNHIKFIINKIIYLDDGNPVPFKYKKYCKNETVKTIFKGYLNIKCNNIIKNKLYINYDKNIRPNTLFLIGDKMAAYGINNEGAKRYANYIKSNYLNKKYEVIYYKHRMEENIPRELSTIGVTKIKNSKIPFELYLKYENSCPNVIISLGSSLLSSLSIIGYNGKLIGINASNFIDSPKMKKRYTAYFDILKINNFCQIKKLD